MMDDLDKLIAAVEAGEEPPLYAALRAIASAARDKGEYWPAHDATKAFDGSLDAALRLHEALLPDHTPLMFGDGVQVHPSVSSIISNDYCIVPGNPARAWLLAILRAVKAKGE